MPDSPHRGWCSRVYLPHRDVPGHFQAITFHMGDSLPQAVLAQMEEQLTALDDSAHAIERRKRIEAYLDAGHGDCWLRRPDIALLVENALLHFDGERYQLMAWVVMPNHVHFLAKMNEGYPLGDVMYSLKSYTAKAANKILERHGPFWQREYHDRFIRDWEHYDSVVRYIERNP